MPKVSRISRQPQFETMKDKEIAEMHRAIEAYHNAKLARVEATNEEVATRENLDNVLVKHNFHEDPNFVYRHVELGIGVRYSVSRKVKTFKIPQSGSAAEEEVA